MLLLLLLLSLLLNCAEENLAWTEFESSCSEKVQDCGLIRYFENVTFHLLNFMMARCCLYYVFMILSLLNVSVNHA